MASPSSVAASSSKEIKNHHHKKDISHKRASYREARWERAVKVYTVNQESKYLMVTGVPSVGATKELLERFAIYGDIEEYRHLDEYPVEEFTEAYWIKYKRIQSARFGKKKMDNRSFFGGLLHAFYAPEYENEEDTREKLMERKRSVLRKCREYFGSNEKEQPTKSQSGGASSPASKLSIPLAGSSVSSNEKHSSSSKLTSNKSQNIPSQASKIISQYPHIPTKQATLPIEIQNLPTEQVYPNQETSVTLQEKVKEVTRAEESKKKIVWNKNAPPNPFSHLHQYTKEPGAWNLYPSAERQVPKDEEVTQSDIRKKLIQTAEQNKANIQIPEVSPLDMIHSNKTQSADVPPSKKKRPNDGRKRI